MGFEYSSIMRWWALHMEYYIYLDESDQVGKHFENFYGGALIRSTDFHSVDQHLRNLKTRLNFHKEVKWTKVSAHRVFLAKYKELIGSFFDLVKEDRVKIRIMFRHRLHRPTGLSPGDHDLRYFKLYYQFVKHAFGLQYSNRSGSRIPLRLFFDQFPDKYEKVASFKGYLAGLNRSEEFRQSQIFIPEDGISEVHSHDQVILQCLDIVLGSIVFRLNDKHKAIPEGKRRRAKLTVAKEDLYNYINRRIREVYPGFNVGESTAAHPIQNRWAHSYRHWKFQPKNYEIDKSAVKPKRKGPVSPT